MQQNSQSNSSYSAKQTNASPRSYRQDVSKNILAVCLLPATVVLRLHVELYVKKVVPYLTKSVGGVLRP